MEAKPAPDAYADANMVSGDAEEWLGVLLGVFERAMPELAAVMKAWPRFSDAVRAGIMAMVGASVAPALRNI